MTDTLNALTPAVDGMEQASAEHRRQLATFLTLMPRFWVGEIEVGGFTSPRVISIPGVTPEFEVFLTPKTQQAAAVTGVYAVASKDQITVSWGSGGLGVRPFACLVIGPRIGNAR